MLELIRFTFVAGIFTLSVGFTAKLPRNLTMGMGMKRTYETHAGVPLSLLLISFSLGTVSAQTFTRLHSFSYTKGVDGGNPQGQLSLSGNSLYGTTAYGGNGTEGTVFKLNRDGTAFTTLNNSPFEGYVLPSGDTLYGTGFPFLSPDARDVVFSSDTNCTSLTVLHSFALNNIGGTNYAPEGATPTGGLLLFGNSLYGVTLSGGKFGHGTVFKVNTDATGFTNLHHFAGYDGQLPQCGLTLSGHTLFGTTMQGGPLQEGTVFAINIDGTGFTNLHAFSGGSDGGWPTAYPGGALVLAGNTLFGTAQLGGSSDHGTVFSVNTDGTGFKVLHSFSDYFGVYPEATNRDGAYPNGGLALSGSTLYGTASNGGATGYGTVFAMDTNGDNFLTLYNFTRLTGIKQTNYDGACPHSGLILANNTLYGTTYQGGSSGYGAVFSISLDPKLSFATSPADLTLTWPTSYAGFDYTGYTLRCTTNLASPIWTEVSAVPVVVDGQSTVTIPKSGTQQFFRLSQ